jgi:hypothetical protein
VDPLRQSSRLHWNQFKPEAAICLFVDSFKAQRSLKADPARGSWDDEAKILPSVTVERSHVHELQLMLRTTLSLLRDHALYVRDGRSLRVLELALLSAVADLEEIGATQCKRISSGQYKTKGP